METTENKRFREVLAYLQQNKFIRFEKEIAEILNVNQDRIKYLKKENGGSLSSDELCILWKKFPQINWVWVKIGEGSMLSALTDQDLSNANEYSKINSKSPDYKELIMLIITGESTLPEVEQKRILIQEVINLQNKLLEIYDLTDPTSLFSNLKNFFK